MSRRLRAAETPRERAAPAEHGRQERHAGPAAERGAAATVLRLQRAVGNRGVLALLPAPAGRLQRQDAGEEKAPADPVREAVAGVKSLRVEEDLKTHVTGAESLLRKKVAQREKELRKAIEHYGEGSTAGKAIQADLEKPLEKVLAEPDSKWVLKGLRDEILKAHRLIEEKKTMVAREEERFHRYDDVFASKAVRDTLAAKGFTPAELKALVSQESLDLEKENDTEGDIAGIAQMGAAEVEEVGEKPEDRLDAKKAIPIAAQVLVKKAELLEAALAAVPAGEEYKKFVIASYNAGQATVAEAQRRAQKMKRAGTTWSDLVRPADGKTDSATSPLYGAIQAKLPSLNPAKKYTETTEYVERIYRRLGR